MNFPKLSRKITISITVVIIALLVGLPIFMGTQSYPIALVNGNSMYPTLQNGDMVIFHSIPQQNIPNGTIIVFVQADTGAAALDSIIKPVVIHRVIGLVVQADGTDYYKTKGDNNQLTDPSLAESTYVLGTPAFVIPKVGIILLFIQSPQGLVASIGFIVLFYLSNYDAKVSEGQKKEKLLTHLAKRVFGGDISTEEFKKFEIAIKYTDDLQDNPLAKNIIDLRPIVTKLKLLGWDVKTLDEISGMSGVKHQFDLVVSSKEKSPHPIVVVDIRIGELPIGESQVISMFAKKFDANPLSAILVSVPSSTPEAKEMAKRYNIIMIDAEKPSQVADTVLGATVSLLDSYRQVKTHETKVIEKQAQQEIEAHPEEKKE
jgi:signal peptidase I